jgi:hypothetical protein
VALLFSPQVVIIVPMSIMLFVVCTLLLGVLSVVATVFYGLLLEWLVHRYVLHGLGRSKKSFWSFHWHEHHRNSRTSMIDPNYQHPWWNTSLAGSRWKEPFGLAVGWLVHLLGVSGALWALGALGNATVLEYFVPLAAASGWLLLLLGAHGLLYYFVHRSSHRDDLWARGWAQGHRSHHLSPQGKHRDNWTVTWWWWVRVYCATVRRAPPRPFQRSVRNRPLQSTVRRLFP